MNGVVGDGGIAIGINILGITDVVTLVAILAIIALVVLYALIRIRRHNKRAETVPDAPQEEIFRLVSRVKYPQSPAPRPLDSADVPRTAVQEPEIRPKDVELLEGRPDMIASMRAIAEKYSLSEITLATDEGLVFVTSADRDVQPDAVKYSQIARHQAPPDEPDVTLFELMHRDSRLIGIIRTPRELPQNWKRQIRDDTKGILQWWL